MHTLKEGVAEWLASPTRDREVVGSNLAFVGICSTVTLLSCS
jgi:hypothetical protein